MNKSIAVLKALLSEQEVQLPDGYTYKLHENIQGKKILGLQLLHYKESLDSDPEVVWTGAEHMTLSYFINQCEEMDSGKVFLLNANVALTEHNRRKSRS